jgi:hypothetical protein
MRNCRFLEGDDEEINGDFIRLTREGREIDTKGRECPRFLQKPSDSKRGLPGFVDVTVDISRVRLLMCGLIRLKQLYVFIRKSCARTQKPRAHTYCLTPL